ncbi:hypothetical protein E4U43_008347 [Claviceps pusilla]|uniref:Uncharacterized protein n=1 Tax=Claviceps pusilla TaxID=123648 RepID=A0A9P7SZR6_9HYPO|nr:hypothetical protein E4U43_008347 [Claviceps pusilla]
MSSTNQNSSNTTLAETSAGSSAAQSPAPAQEHVFPQPQGDIDIEEALQRKPLRWTFQGQVEANKSRPVAAVSDDDVRKRNLDQAKQDLLEMQGSLYSDTRVRNKSATRLV